MRFLTIIIISIFFSINTSFADCNQYNLSKVDNLINKYILIGNTNQNIIKKATAINSKIDKLLISFVEKELEVSEKKICTLHYIRNYLNNKINNPTFFVATILIDGIKESSTSLETIKSIRKDLEEINPNITVTWALTNNFVFQEEHRKKLEYILSLVDNNGDNISMGYGFPNNRHTLESFKKATDEWMYMYRYNTFPNLHEVGTIGDKSVYASIPDRYKPKSITTYAINNEQAQYIKNTYGIDSFMGWTATQYKVDQLTGDGSPLMPYFSHKNNPMIPAQSDIDSSGNIFLNTITVDPIGSRYTSGESRWTIHPADPVTNGVSQLHTINQYINNPYFNYNSINYLSLFIDVDWIYNSPNLLKSWKNIIFGLKNSNNIKILSIKDFTNEVKNRVGNNNNSLNFTLQFTGSGLEKEMEGVIYKSDKNLTYLWTETKEERLILSKKDGETKWKVIDFTNYDKKIIPKLKYTEGKGNEVDLSYITGRNFKVSPDGILTMSDRLRIIKRLKEINFTEKYDF